MPKEAQSASPKLSPELPSLDCACATVRRTAHLVTQLYAQEMAPDVEPTQFALLAAFHARPGIAQTALGRALGLDKTTLSRNLSLMRRNGWIAVGDGKRHQLTPAGEQLLCATRPGWMRAQQKLRSALAQGEWETTLKVLGLVATAARSALRATEKTPQETYPNSGINC